MAKKTVVLGLVGSTLDAGKGNKRWGRWRPTVGLCSQEQWHVDRLELIAQPRTKELAELVADDVARVSPSTEVRVHEIELHDAWDFEVVYGALHDFARAYRFDAAREEYFVHITTGTHVAQICLFLLTEARYLPARLVQTASSKGDTHGTVRVIDLDLSRYDALARRFERERADVRSFLKQGIETRNVAFNRTIERIERVALVSRDPVLFVGPTGAGKSQLARQVYALKRDRGQIAGELVEVNCATLRGDQAMSALFGHTKGAFTGAAGARPGLLRTADGGALFLDEIGELGGDEQAMLLRAIETGRFLPVGSDHEVESRFQLFAGTNRDLREAVRAGRFREDLLARIDLWTFELPGLAERREDLEPNLDHELERASRRLSRHVSINDAARKRFLQFASSSEALWRASFRDLGAAVLRMATLAHGGRIDVAAVDEEIDRLRWAWSEPRPASRQRAAGPSRVEQALGERAADLDRFDRVQLEDVLEVCAQARSLSDAGRMLFSESRKKRTSVNDADRLRKYLARFGLAFDELPRALTP